jgi:fructose-1,6-bisphosphatase/inositol monophosphatase family enzyme
VSDSLVDAVAAALRDVADELVLPRFRALADAEVREKGAGELVTVVDTEVEERLTAVLAGLLPGSVVVGEEAATGQPALLDGLGAAARPVWLVDPLDGTRLFAEGSPDFAVMVALVVGGDAVGSWIHQPARARSFAAERGSGAFADGAPLVDDPSPPPPGGIVKTRYPPPETGRLLRERAAELGGRRPASAAGIEYPEVAEGRLGHLLYWRLRPWDHAAGALLCREAGRPVARLDGRPYRPFDRGAGLLAAADDATFGHVLRVLDPDGSIAALAATD